MSGTGYERRDIPAKGAALALAGVLASIFVVGAVVAAILGWVDSGTPPTSRAIATPPPPRLQVMPEVDRARIEAAAKARLRGDAGHPSIEEAMRIVAAEGWHDRLPASSVSAAARAHVEDER